MAGRLPLEIAVNKTHTREQNWNSAHSPEAQASAYGTQMAKYFTMKNGKVRSRRRVLCPRHSARRRTL